MLVMDIACCRFFIISNFIDSNIIFFIVFPSRKGRNEMATLPRLIKELLSSTKRCPCGQLCVLEGSPFVYSFDGSKLTHTMAYNQGRVDLKVLSYLCSAKCLQLYTENPVHFQRRGTKRNIQHR